ncbi:MAG TPA: hypothetical protein VNX15_11050 [Gemmatimonadales bacterium]|jgi:hypothetical protein|nr:hypothetical protein [Gemmatimonadales bacterium]
MLASFQQSLPEQWRETLQFVASGFTWIIDWQRVVLGFAVTGDSVGIAVLKAIVMLLPAALLVAAVWCTMASLYTLPFRSGRGGFLTALLLSWWDAGRMIWFYWAGLLRFLVVLLGWIWGLLKLAGSLFVGLVKFLFTRPLALLDWATRQYFQPGVPWIAFVIILFWSALEATIFTFTLRPTLTEVLADLTGSQLSGLAVTLILWPFLFILISGSFAAIQALAEAVRARKTSQIVSMVLVEAFVMFFEVMFLYRELIDAITPWIAQQTGFQLGFFSTLALASFGWVGVRAMTWFLFGRFGTPALLGILGRQSMAGTQGTVTQTPALQPDFWKAPIAALKAETEWFRKEAREVFELISLPVLQILAAALNFAVVVILGKPVFVLPFRNLEQVLASTPLLSGGGAAAKHPASGAA